VSKKLEELRLEYERMTNPNPLLPPQNLSQK
jgi:hypothetical protein